MTKIKPVLRYPESKTRIAPWIVSHMPAQRVYIEPYCGSLSVLLAKPIGALEVVNDFDGRVCNLFRVLRDQPEELARLIALTPWSREEYQASDIVSEDPVEDARRFLVRCWQSVGTLTRYRSGWKCDFRANAPAASVWSRLPERIVAVARRLQGVLIENRPALDIIARHSRPEVCFYVDPPYLFSTRSRKYYRHEMEDEEHVELLALLERHPGPVLLSGYDSALYAERLAHWTRRSASAWTTAGAEMTEVLWLNPVAARLQARRLPGMDEEREEE